MTGKLGTKLRWRWALAGLCMLPLVGCDNTPRTEDTPNAGDNAAIQTTPSTLSDGAVPDVSPVPGSPSLYTGPATEASPGVVNPPAATPIAGADMYGGTTGTSTIGPDGSLGDTGSIGTRGSMQNTNTIGNLDAVTTGTMP